MRFFLSLIVAGLCVPFGVLAQESVKLTTVDWCPFTCSADPDKGLFGVVVSEAFKAVDATVEFEFLPWLRAIEKAKTAEGEVSGYFPALLPEVGEEFEASIPVGYSGLGLAMRVDSPELEATPEGLRALKLGTVAGYANSKLVTAAIEAGLKPDESNTDATNLRKLISGRVDAIEIDPTVLEYFLRMDPQFSEAKDRVVIKVELGEEPMFIAFAKTSLGQRHAELFARGIGKVDLLELREKYFATRP